ncbi:MAG: DUF1648 domain-containing protein [Gemmatimonadetes bacterium]|nr:DUF1648 domain-containing protein [Gemmatimonadota bacterium]MBI3568546.1 DUF1648 domain-containing protein [Gemmatimonadota bacterium]
MRPSRLALIVAFVLNVAACAYYWPTAPAVLWSHFTGSGVPDGRMPKEGFFLMWIALTALPTVIGLGYGLLLPRLSLRSINMPNKELWLAPERREETFRDLADMIAWLTAPVSLFLLATNIEIVAANARTPVRLGPATTINVVVLLAVIFAVVIRYLLHWSSPPER